MTDEARHRQRAIAHVATASGWDALKTLIQDQARYVRVDLADPNWAVRMAYQAGRIEFGLELLKIVEVAVARTTRAEEEPHG